MTNILNNIQFDSPYTMKVISSELLTVDREKYQREEEKSKIRDIVSDWDERIANEPKVSERNGQFYVFDGQHTVISRETLNHGQPTPILCKVYSGLTVNDEAMLFAKQTGSSSKPKPGQQLRAYVFAGDQDAIAFCEATELTGLIVEQTGTRYDGHLACVSTARRIYRKIGEEFYVEALQIIVDAWHGNADSLRYEIIKAVSEFVKLYHGKYNREQLIRNLKAVPPIKVRNNIVIDLERPNNKKFIYQIWQIYNGNSKKHTLKMMF